MQASRSARIGITGQLPGLVLNNGILADETNKFALQIAELVDAGRGRKKLTDDQRERKELLNWRGSLYVNQDGQIYLPANNLFRAIVAAAKEYKLGTAIEDRGAVTIHETELPLIIEPGKNSQGIDHDIDRLWKDARYRFRTLVNPNPTSGKKGLLPLVRPVFPAWGIVATVTVFPEMINWEAFIRIMETAGRVGVGNARKIGYGRFTTAITELKA